jgi:hypothetical protein
MPGGSRRLTRAPADACTAEAEPITGGMSMPSTVTAGRAHSMSAGEPLPISSTPSSTLASERNCPAGYSTPVHVCVLSSPSIVVLPCASRSRSAFSGTNASRPPVPCSSEPSQISLIEHGNPPRASRSARTS